MASNPQKFRVRGLAIVGALVLAGCYGSGTTYNSSVTGSVTIDGQLAHGGTVTFHPVDSGPMAISPIYADGSYVLQVGQGRMGAPNKGTLPSGKYIATVVVLYKGTDQNLGEGGPPDPGPYLIDEKYRLKETSDLRHTVKPGKNVIHLELQRRMVEDESPATVEPDDVARDSDPVPAPEKGDAKTPPANTAQPDPIPSDASVPANPQDLPSSPEGDGP